MRFSVVGVREVYRHCRAERNLIEQIAILAKRMFEQNVVVVRYRFTTLVEQKIQRLTRDDDLAKRVCHSLAQLRIIFEL